MQCTILTAIGRKKLGPPLLSALISIGPIVPLSLETFHGIISPLATLVLFGHFTRAGTISLTPTKAVPASSSTMLSFSEMVRHRQAQFFYKRVCMSQCCSNSLKALARLLCICSGKDQTFRKKLYPSLPCFSINKIVIVKLFQLENALGDYAAYVPKDPAFARFATVEMIVKSRNAALMNALEMICATFLCLVAVSMNVEVQGLVLMVHVTVRWALHLNHNALELAVREVDNVQKGVFVKTVFASVVPIILVKTASLIHVHKTLLFDQD
eukprot:Lithocolla_globosa_v1_NODE_1225_length_2759_cov_6.159763.p2 type:complete len:269 gc:universal NODE_1225_length_2759_cov_6.159763:1646-840(-)